MEDVTRRRSRPLSRPGSVGTRSAAPISLGVAATTSWHSRRTRPTGPPPFQPNPFRESLLRLTSFDVTPIAEETYAPLFYPNSFFQEVFS